METDRETKPNQNRQAIVFFYLKCGAIAFNNLRNQKICKRDEHYVDFYRNLALAYLKLSNTLPHRNIDYQDSNQKQNEANDACIKIKLNDAFTIEKYAQKYDNVARTQQMSQEKSERAASERITDGGLKLLNTEVFEIK